MHLEPKQRNKCIWTRCVDKTKCIQKQNNNPNAPDKNVLTRHGHLKPPLGCLTTQHPRHIRKTHEAQTRTPQHRPEPEHAQPRAKPGLLTTQHPRHIHKTREAPKPEHAQPRAKPGFLTMQHARHIGQAGIFDHATRPTISRRCPQVETRQNTASAQVT